MKPIATDIYTFSELVKEGYAYVDKTAYLLDLIAGKYGKQFFLARPRRFGKSLTISTFQAIFEGRRELFRGLAIEASDYDWKTYPVIRLDMASCQAETVEEFWGAVLVTFQIQAERLGIALRGETVPGKFQFLIEDAARKSADGQVVLLVDEYDKPLLGHLGRPTVEAFRTALKSFYSVIKTMESCQRFAFITGVSKFSKVSIFSDLNNLTDLTMDARVATMLGYTHDEVKANFPEHLVALGEANGLTPEEAFNRVIAMYDGYRFHPAAERVVNPVSLGRCLSSREFNEYWYETGTPTFLVDALKRQPLQLSGYELSNEELGTYEPSRPALPPLLYQTGYLTIRDAEKMGGRSIFHLDFPNEEVRNAFNTSLVPAYTGGDAHELGSAQLRCARALIAHDLDAFFESLEVFFADIPYNLTDRGGEQIFQAILYTVLRFIGVCVQTEVTTNRGRIDAVVTTENDVYVIEIKLDKSAADALAQIKEKKYHEKYLASGRRVTLVGMNFSSAGRTVTEWKVEDVR